MATIGNQRMRLLKIYLPMIVGFCVAGLNGPAAFGDRVVYEKGVVVYGGTSAGVVAAVQAARMSKMVALIEPGRHLGGMSAAGLGATDIGNKDAIGGISREFYQRVGRHYGWKEAWRFEPHVAEKVFNYMAHEAGVSVFLEKRIASVKKNGRRIETVVTHDGVRFRAKVFIDASYEGDLMAQAGVSYTVGRESNSQYDEDLNGVWLNQWHHQFEVPVDPYVVEGDPNSGLLPGVHGGDPGKQGRSDHRVQAYNFRMCLTKDPQNRIPFPKPADYDPSQYELLARYLQKAEVQGLTVPILHHTMMPNNKTDTNNNGGFSTDYTEANHDYPEGNWATRERIIKEHRIYQQGLMWFLCNDPRVPERIRKEVGQWSLCKDEFKDNGGWPHQLYIREGRRMVSGYVMTQHNCESHRVAQDSVGLASFGMDSHNCQRFIKDGAAWNGGNFYIPVPAPYPIAYRSIVPKQSECTNLLVPVCLSASHVAFGSIRMEPVFMILGQSAATAACLAIDGETAVQDVDIRKLQARLRADKQILLWRGEVRIGKDAKALPGIVIDDRDAEIVGNWLPSNGGKGYVGNWYLHDYNKRKGQLSVRFYLPIVRSGRYQVRLAYTPYNNRASNVPVTIRHAEGVNKVMVNMRKVPQEPDGFLTLGIYRFATKSEAYIEISNNGTDGYVIADAVQLLPAGHK
ncbi:MAG: FAD-dependent oxidoreductase [Planctomycetota bacterium]|nr:MAG: FAD-dependent oxidoreductase [Planctomycetota bacterium]